MNDITFSKLLSSVMLDNKYDRFVKNRRTGKLNTTSLYKVNTSSRLFKRREARKNKNYAVSLVVDCSGSMAGSKLQMAASCAAKLSHHLAKIGIPHNVVLFNAGVEQIKKFDTKELPTLEQDIVGQLQSGDTCLNGKRATDKGKHYFWDAVARKKSLIRGRALMPFMEVVEGQGNIFGKMRELEDEASKRGGRIYDSVWMCPGGGYNSDAEALVFARKLLLNQVGTKLMIFLSDGQPAALSSDLESPINPGYSQHDFDLKNEVRNTIKSGIELYSVGIMNDAVNKYYPPRRTATINSIEQLYPHIIKLVKLNLKRG